MQGVYLGVVVPCQLRPHIAGQELAASKLRHEDGATRACKASFSDPCGSSSSTHAVWSSFSELMFNFEHLCAYPGPNPTKKINIGSSNLAYGITFLFQIYTVRIEALFLLVISVLWVNNNKKEICIIDINLSQTVTYPYAFTE